MKTHDINTVRNLAENWRNETGRKSGVVLVWRGTVYGWKDKLRNPEQERPGAFAVCDDGVVYVATGGDDQHGASKWQFKG